MIESRGLNWTAEVETRVSARLHASEDVDFVVAELERASANGQTTIREGMKDTV